MSRRGRPAPSSWAAYVPAIALLGGAALVERLSGGAGWHGMVAGGVRTVAVAAGGGRRLAGPMLAGTALLVAVTVHESLGALAGVPTWAWLSLGGSVPLAIGVARERSDTSPVEPAGESSTWWPSASDDRHSCHGRAACPYASPGCPDD